MRPKAGRPTRTLLMQNFRVPAASHARKGVIYVVLQNNEYGILKEFATLEQTPQVPGLDLPGIDIVSLAKGYGARALQADTVESLAAAYKEALASQGTSVIVTRITRQLGSLISR